MAVRLNVAITLSHLCTLFLVLIVCVAFLRFDYATANENDCFVAQPWPEFLALARAGTRTTVRTVF